MLSNCIMESKNDNTDCENLLRKYLHEIRNMKTLDKEMINNIRNMSNEDKMNIIIEFNNIVENIKIFMEKSIF